MMRSTWLLHDVSTLISYRVTFAKSQKTVYRPNLKQKSDADILRDAKLEAMGMPPQDDATRRSYHERAQMATDELVGILVSLYLISLTTNLGHGTVQKENAEVDNIQRCMDRLPSSVFLLLFNDDLHLLPRTTIHRNHYRTPTDMQHVCQRIANYRVSRCVMPFSEILFRSQGRQLYLRILIR
jgi:hypothetical protein